MLFIGKPAANLANQIELCWSSESSGGDKKAIYEILPTGNMVLMFQFSSSDCRSFLFGPVTTRVHLEVDETCDYFCIRFLPGQAPQLADVHPTDLVNSYMELPKFFGASVEALGERLLFSPSHASRQQIMEGLICGMRPFVEEDRCRWGSALIEASRGRISVEELACHLGVHVRSVERSFLNHLGISPKRLIRIIRFQYFMAQFRAGYHRNFADLAYVCGFSDQSHMIKELKDLTGRLPSEITSSLIRLEEQSQAIPVLRHQNI